MRHYDVKVVLVKIRIIFHIVLNLRKQLFHAKLNDKFLEKRKKLKQLTREIICISSAGFFL